MAADIQRDIETVRRFNRFYTREIGVLREGLLRSEFPLTQARVIYELASRGEAVASALAGDLGLDPGYLSRILRGFAKRGLVSRERSPDDARHTILRLTEAGREAFAVLNTRSRDEIGALLGRLGADERSRLVGAMQAIERLLGAAPETRAPFVLRPHQPGDLGWVVMRHGLRYAQEYGWDETFEALVAEIAARFVREYDPRRERCWIAEKDAERVGSIFLARASDEVAKIRLLLVEPSARGLGLGSRLVEECVRFARRTGYRTISLWTVDILLAARRIYERAGFVLVASEPHRGFGHDLVGETWELALDAPER